jgi:ATP-dependent helicase HrpA
MKYEYPQELPVSAAHDDIAAAVASSQVVIVSGQTGSGKTTQIPKILLEMGRGTHGHQIVHTQPRRIAARTVAERIASEMGVRLGDEIGYQVRFTDASSPKNPSARGHRRHSARADPARSAPEPVRYDHHR